MSKTGLNSSTLSMTTVYSFIYIVLCTALLSNHIDAQLITLPPTFGHPTKYPTMQPVDEPIVCSKLNKKACSNMDECKWVDSKCRNAYFSTKRPTRRPTYITTSGPTSDPTSYPTTIPEFDCSELKKKSVCNNAVYCKWLKKKSVCINIMKPPTRSPTVDGYTYAPTKRPTKRPTKKRTNTPTMGPTVVYDNTTMSPTAEYTFAPTDWDNYTLAPTVYNGNITHPPTPHIHECPVCPVCTESPTREPSAACDVSIPVTITFTTMVILYTM